MQFALKSRLGNAAYFLGCVPSDFLATFSIPKIRPKTLTLIVNTLPSFRANEMGHWICMAFSATPLDNIIYFDSLGQDPKLLSPYFKDFLERHNDMMVFTTKKCLQPFDSLMCGFYCLLFTHRLTHHGIGKTLHDVKKELSSVALYRNDFIVLRYYFNYLNSKSCAKIWRMTKPKFSMAVCQIMKARGFS